MASGPEWNGRALRQPRSPGEVEPLFSTNALEAARATERSPLARFNLVTQNPGLIAGLSESARIATEIGIRAIEERAMLISDLLRGEASSIDGCTLLSPMSRESACGW